MPNYYNPANFYPVTYQTPYTGNAYGAVPQPMMSGGQSSTNQYMINVDGEGSARAWQPSMPVGPNTIIPLWDLDGQHVYFKSTDAYGRLNPIRKGRVIFEDEQMLPQGQSGAGSPENQQAQPVMPSIDTSQFLTKHDLDQFKNEIKAMLGSRNQNGKQYDQNNRGETK